MEPIKQYINFDTAYGYYNEHLFENKLPGCMLTLQRHKGSNGYFCKGKFQDKETGTQTIDEIALNPDRFCRSEKMVFSTMAHEMVHQWQEYYGEPSQTGYHNKEWAAAMERIGLMPSTTGDVGGRKVGQSVTHYIIPGGTFDTLTDELLKDKMINWESIDYDSHIDYVQVSGGYTPGEPVTVTNTKKLEPGYTVSYAGNFFSVESVDSEEGTAIIMPQGTDLAIPEGATLTVLKTQGVVARKKKDKVCYQCPKCRCKVWGKPNLYIGCLDCDEALQVKEY